MINLSTPSKQMLDEINEDLKAMKYWQARWNSGRDFYNRSCEYCRKWNKLRKPFLGKCHEYKSRNGNRWYVYDVPFWPEGFDDMMVLQSSFIYYETYASIGAFIPKFEMNPETGKFEDSCAIYTAHFFQRYCERLGIPYKSRKMVTEFAGALGFTPFENDTDKDGRPIVVARMPKAGYTYGVRRSDDPHVIEMRTFLSDNNMTPTKLKKYDDLRKRVDDDSFIIESYNLGVMGSLYQMNDIPVPKE